MSDTHSLSNLVDIYATTNQNQQNLQALVEMLKQDGDNSASKAFTVVRREPRLISPTRLLSTKEDVDDKSRNGFAKFRNPS